MVLIRVGRGNSKWFEPGFSKSIHPIDNKYNLGDISSKIVFKITCKVPDEGFTSETTTYRNSAIIAWDNFGGNVGSGDKVVGVGYNLISKKSTKMVLQNRQITWGVIVDPKGQNILNLRV